MTSVVPQDDLIHQQILKAAIRLYQKHGPDSITMDDLAAATGRSRTSLYYYYKNRDEIYDAVMGKIAADMAVEIRRAVATVETLYDKIFAFCDAKLRASKEWKKVFAAMLSSTDGEEQSKHQKTLYNWHKKVVYNESTILNEILTNATRRKEMRPISAGDQDTLVFLVYSGIRGMRREIDELDDPHDMNTALRLLTDMVFNWLKK
jgi:AcrR family transcriptional regulator